MFRLGLLLWLLALPALAHADILMWRDAEGVRHYTNLQRLVPADATASTILEDVPQPASAVTAAPQPAPEPEAAPPRMAEVVYDQSALSAAYQEGWQRGMSSVQQTQNSGPVTVQINGPLVGGYGSFGYFDPAWYYAPSLVTTSFDGGRSRHLTLRMLMQDQFAIDREGPYLAIDRFPPLGPNLATVLPRGLPYFVKPGSRVINY